MSKLNRAVIVLAGLGLFDALYLLVIKLTDEPSLCIQGVGDCWSVNTSKFSEIMGIPISIFGAAAFLAIVFIQVFEQKSAFLKKYAPLALFGITLTGSIYSAYLTYVEIWVIHAICPFCVFSALVMFILMILSLQKLKEVRL